MASFSLRESMMSDRLTRSWEGIWGTPRTRCWGEQACPSWPVTWEREFLLPQGPAYERVALDVTAPRWPSLVYLCQGSTLHIFAVMF